MACLDVYCLVDYKKTYLVRAADPGRRAGPPHGEEAARDGAEADGPLVSRPLPPFPLGQFVNGVATRERTGEL